MQFTDAQRQFFIDPVQDPTIMSDRILVLEERVNRGTHLHKIVAVTKDRHCADNRHWWITEDGYHVYGAPVNPSSVSGNRRLVAPGGDGWFWLGQPGRAQGGNYLLGSVRRSDGRQLPGRGNTGGSALEVPNAVLAAPWADELFPGPADSDDVIRAKLALAEQRWMHRRAKAEIIRQGMGRGWDDDLSTLRESGKLPMPSFGAYYRGQAMIATVRPPEFTARDVERLQEFRDRVPTTSDAATYALMGVQVNVPFRMSISSFEDIRNLSLNTIREHLRNATDDYSAVPGDHTLTPVLRSIAA